jgi:soluble lytic murein transglycosylase-like protein
MKLLLLTSLFTTLFATNEAQVYNIASRHTKSPEIVTAIAKTETHLKPNKTSCAGALGIMQIKPVCARFVATKYKEMAFINRMSDKQLQHMLLTNDAINIEIGSKYYEYLHNRYSTKKAISKYNACENDRYYNKVMENL